ncbi:MAG: hypothetical protein R3E01_09400 [Pirellulaceae bacterium]|nr:hypothetical protein [Planctomycetales bacterium]
MDVFHKLVNDDAGFIVSLELVLIATILVIGLIAGLAVVRDAIVSELSDVGGAIQDLNQSYRYSGVNSRSASTAGSSFQDRSDWADSAGDPSGRMDNCIVIFGTSDEH